MAGDVAVVTLTRPDALNALSEELLSQFADVVREAGAHGTIGGRSVTAIVLTGAGRSFVAGADVKEFHGKSADAVDALAWKNISVFTELENLALPVVALVDGFALGGGNELAMSAHYRIVTENALLGQPEVKLGIIPGYGGMQRLPRLIGPSVAADICVNGEPVDGSTAVSLGWADEFVPASAALPRAIAAARAFAAGERPVPRRDWDALAAGRKEELAILFARPEVKAILEAPTPGKETAGNLRAARLAAARDALLAMKHGFERGFEEGLRNDARMFGAVAASPGGQEWVGRFLAKDAAQSSFLTILPPADPAEGKRPPITKKAPGDRPISFVEIGEIASILKEKMNTGGVTPLPKKILGDVIALLKERPSPAILREIDPATSGNVGARIASLLTRGKISVRVVDLGPDEGFRRENARPTCEVLLVEKDGEILWEGKKRFRTEPGASPRVFLPKAFLERNASRPHVVYQAIVHPILEWVFGYPHMIAVLCESAYNAAPAGDAGGLSDLNRYIAEGAGRDRDFPYFDRILVDAYEPEDFRKEELANFFGGDEGKVGAVLARAREMGTRYRERVAEIREGVRGEIAAGQVAAGRAALDEGDAERALHLLRSLVLSPETPSPYREAAADGIAVAIRSYALGADPAFEGVTVAAGEVTVERWAGPRARDLSRLLSLALSLAGTIPRERSGSRGTGRGRYRPPQRPRRPGARAAFREVHRRERRPSLGVREGIRPPPSFRDGRGEARRGDPRAPRVPLLEGRLFPGREAIDRAAVLRRRQGDSRGVPFLPVAPGRDAEADGGNVRAASSGRSAVPPFRDPGDGGESRPRQPHDPEDDGPDTLVPARPVPGHRPRGKGRRGRPAAARGWDGASLSRRRDAAETW